MDRILLRFSEENVEDPITSQVILDLGIPMRIVTATVNSSGGDILVGSSKSSRPQKSSKPSKQRRSSKVPQTHRSGLRQMH